MPVGDLHRQRRGRNLAMGLALGSLALIFFLITMAKLGLVS